MKITHPFPWVARVSFEAGEREAQGPVELFEDGSGPRLLRASFEEKTTYKTVVDGEPVTRTKLTANGTVSEIVNAVKVPDRTVSRAALTFSCGADELLTGLGQHDSGVYDYHGKNEYLYQNNMIIAYPFLLSSAGYGVLIEAECAMRFAGGEDSFTFVLEAADGFSFVVFRGADCREVLRHLAQWTGENAPFAQMGLRLRAIEGAVQVQPGADRHRPALSGRGAGAGLLGAGLVHLAGGPLG